MTTRIQAPYMFPSANKNMITTVPNADLEVVAGNKSHWTHADHRRHGFHNLHTIARYSVGFRAARVMPLRKCMDLRIADFEPLRHITSLPWFSAMVVIRGQHVLFERYAPDFGPARPHSIQSITKTSMNLIVGRLVEEEVLDLSRRVSEYVPEIGSGYAGSTLQQVLNMDVVNEYSEDFADPQATYYRHEEAMGWRLPRDPTHEPTHQTFIADIKSDDTTNRTGQVQYKDANTEVLGWVVERASGRPLRAFLADIVDAAGLEGILHITTDRTGFPTLDGGACVSARDLARYFAIFLRGGRGVEGEQVGSGAFIDRTMLAGVPMCGPYEGIRYSNHLMVAGRTLGHGGWGGQHVIGNLDTGAVAVFFSVLENEHATNGGYIGLVIQMLDSVTGPEFQNAR
jgi:CubicO group peptidase (beta-lactamase class C family)